MTTEATQPDTTPTDLPAGDTTATATATAPEGKGTEEGTAAPTEDELILSAIRGEEPAKTEGEAADKEGGPADKAKPEANPGEKKPDDDGKGPEAKADDAILDEETPKDYKGRTREQFDKLKEAGRRHREEAQALQAKLTELAPNIEREANFTRLLVDSEGTPEDIGTAISLIRAVNKGTPEEKRGAIQIAQAVVQILADQLGEALPGLDYLAGHDDLKQRVADGDLSQADAQEIAVLRRKTKAADETTAQAAARQKREAEERAATETETAQRESAARDVQAKATAFLQRDGEAAYKIRATYASQQAERIAKRAKLTPAEIPELFVELYDSPEAQLLVDAATATTRQAKPTGVRPVMGAARGGQSAHPEAMSEQDAVLMALRGG